MWVLDPVDDGGHEDAQTFCSSGYAGGGFLVLKNPGFCSKIGFYLGIYWRLGALGALGDFLQRLCLRGGFLGGFPRKKSPLH